VLPVTVCRLSLSLSLSVSVTRRYCIETAAQIELVFGIQAFFGFHTLYFTDVTVSPNIRLVVVVGVVVVVVLCKFSHTMDLAMKRPRRRARQTSDSRWFVVDNTWRR